MDRMYKKEDLVHVYQSRHGELVTSFKQRPYTLHGMDNYKYGQVMYKGYNDFDTNTVYILLTDPCVPENCLF